MESLLEQHRRSHEERERLEETMVREMMAKKNTVSIGHAVSDWHHVMFVSHPESGSDQQWPSAQVFIGCEYILNDMIYNKWNNAHEIQRYKKVTEDVAEMYEDKDGSRKREIQKMTGPNEFQEFYSRLRSIKEHYKKGDNNEISIPISSELDEFLKSRGNTWEANLIEFTDEEGYGKFLDLNQSFNLYLNIRGLSKIDYLSYLDCFDRLFEIPKDRKMSSDYRRYLETLFEYLADYCSKVKPLLNLQEVSHVSSKQFESFECLDRLEVIGSKLLGFLMSITHDWPYYYDLNISIGAG